MSELKEKDFVVEPASIFYPGHGTEFPCILAGYSGWGSAGYSGAAGFHRLRLLFAV